MEFKETICAISTAPGVGAIAVIRLSGPESIAIADKVFKKRDGKSLAAAPASTIHYGTLFDGDLTLDEVLVSLFKAPHSYTGEDTIEISCHGSLFIQQKVLELLVKNGAALAKPGEFTLRAFLSGKLDLSQAEGVADLIASGSEAAHKIAISQLKGGFSAKLGELRNELLNFISLIELELDFSEEDVEFADRTAFKSLVKRIELTLGKLVSSFSYGNAIKNGIPVAIVGKTNAGKSTLLNQLLGEEKAIVSNIHGTTRDFIEDTMVIEGITFRFIDTAGLRHTKDQVENIGIERALEKYQQASVVIVLIDAKDSIEDIENSLQFLELKEGHDRDLLFGINKIDLDSHSEDELEDLERFLKPFGKSIRLSAKTGQNIEAVQAALIAFARRQAPESQEVIVSNVRHFESLQGAHIAIQRVEEGIESGISTDLLAMDIREVLHYLGEITGEITTDEVLGNIFKNFCIGK